MIIDEEEYLAHYGTLRKSGRYPWGSGGDQNTRNMMFLDYVANLKRQGLTDAQIGRGLALEGSDENPDGLSSTKIRALKSIANNEVKAAKIAQARALAEKGNSNVGIGRIMGVPESTIRSWLADGEKEKVDSLQALASVLKDQVAERGLIDVGSGNEYRLNCTDTKLKTALAILEEEGYAIHSYKVTQQGTGFETIRKVLAPPGTTQKDVFLRRGEVATIGVNVSDDGSAFSPIQPPLKINPKRVAVNYSETGGHKADGVIFVREGVPDVSLGKARYAQVRVQVGDGHYLKGMAMYRDNMPDGVDIIFNTNKAKKDTPTDLDAMKAIGDDPTNPFGTIVRQIGDKDERGRVTKVTSAMNIVHEEGDWGKWSKNIASQVLSKQSPALARQQLAMTYEARKKQFEDILSLTNPTVRAKMLQEFADSTDSAAVHLKAAHLPRQGWHAILPISSLPPTQIYAPNYNNGERVALIRYPHGGTFEIPELIVNNNHRESKRLLGSNPRDAVGIHHSVAERLSGADFDGDTVLVIPNNTNRIKSTAALEGLKGFNPRIEYKGYPGMKIMSNTQTEMGKISNLITDMTLRNASTDHMARAIRHSMVVIDAEKHGLNYKLSEERNGIKALKAEYQPPDPVTGRGGAATLISRAKAKVFVEDRKDRLAREGGPFDPLTGKRQYSPTGKVNSRTGQPKMIRTTRLAETDDAHTLSSGTPIERLYADHSNRLKDLANQSRIALGKTPKLVRDPSAAKVYAPEVRSLVGKLSIAIQNRPLERQAQALAATMIKAKIDANPDMDKKLLTKVRFLAQTEARNRVGAGKEKIEITQREWDAIQAGAISHSRLKDILDNADMEIVHELARPPGALLMTPSKIASAKAKLALGYTRAEVAAQLGVSVTTLDEAT